MNPPQTRSSNHAHTQKKSRKPRHVYTAPQKALLEKAYQALPVPGVGLPPEKVRLTIAKQTGLSITQISVWFNNRRAKQRRLYGPIVSSSKADKHREDEEEDDAEDYETDTEAEEETQAKLRPQTQRQKAMLREAAQREAQREAQASLTTKRRRDSTKPDTERQAKRVCVGTREKERVAEKRESKSNRIGKRSQGKNKENRENGESKENTQSYTRVEHGKTVLTRAAESTIEQEEEEDEEEEEEEEEQQQQPEQERETDAEEEEEEADEQEQGAEREEAEEPKQEPRRANLHTQHAQHVKHAPSGFSPLSSARSVNNSDSKNSSPMQNHKNKSIVQSAAAPHAVPLSRRPSLPVCSPPSLSPHMQFFPHCPPHPQHYAMHAARFSLSLSQPPPPPHIASCHPPSSPLMPPHQLANAPRQYQNHMLSPFPMWNPFTSPYFAPCHPSIPPVSMPPHVLAPAPPRMAVHGVSAPAHTHALSSSRSSPSPSLPPFSPSLTPALSPSSVHSSLPSSPSSSSLSSVPSSPSSAPDQKRPIASLASSSTQSLFLHAIGTSSFRPVSSTLCASVLPDMPVCAPMPAVLPTGDIMRPTPLPSLPSSLYAPALSSCSPVSLAPVNNMSLLLGK